MNKKTLADYIDLLNNPPEQARGFTRWWWYGNAVTREEIKKELSYMQEAGIGGVEIQFVYPLHENSPNLGIVNHQFFSPDFFELLRYTVDTAEQMGLQVDLTLGSGWPFGGPFVPYEMAPDMLIPYQQDVIGPRTYSYDFTTILPGQPYKVIMGKIENGKLIEESLRDITDKLVETFLHGWKWGYRLEDVEVPEGFWKIYYFVINPYKQLVGVAAPGMEGYVIDHCRADVSDFYFKTLGDPLIEKLGQGRIRTFFCDSIELGGNNWTKILLDEFKKRRGYDLSPYLPALWGEIGDITPFIRYDYYRTFSELTIENFFEKFTGWCHSKGSKSRIQAHGTWADILKAYAAADIPEGETFGEQDKYEVNVVHRRLASSAGHVYGRKIISNESFTWLRMPRFLVTLEMMKAAVDAIFLDGINHIINHGYSYSPEAVGKPGWVFYASSFISHNNTWWEYYPILSRYIHVVSAFLQQGNSYAEVGIYLPQADIWSSIPMAELHMAMKLEEHIGKETVNRIQKAGYYFDFLNDEAIVSLSALTEQGMIINENCYKVIILPRVSRMSVETAKRLYDFVVRGGILIALETRPQFSCGFLDRVAQTSELVRIIDQLFATDNDVWKKVGYGKTIVVSDNDFMMLKTLKDAIIPDLRIEDSEQKKNPDQLAQNVIGYVHRKDGNCDIYFVSNISSNYYTARLYIRCSSNHAIFIDPMKRTITNIMSFSNDQSEVKMIELKFEPYESLFIIFSPEKILDGNPEVLLNNNKREIVKIIDISENWLLTVSEKDFSTTLAQIGTWEKIEELKYFSGTGFYQKLIELSLPRQDEQIFLEFEKVHEVAEVFVNGFSVGVLWKDPRRIEITNFVREGLNDIRVKVVNLWINHIIDPSRIEEYSLCPVTDNWPYFTTIIDQKRKERLYSLREREQIKHPVPSGISGFVKLEYVKRVE